MRPKQHQLMQMRNCSTQVIYFLEVDDDGPWFSDSEERVLFRNCPEAPTYSLERIGHFCKDISYVSKREMDKYSVYLK